MGGQQSISIQAVSFAHLDISIKPQAQSVKQLQAGQAVVFPKNRMINKQQRKFIFECCKSYSFFSGLPEKKLLQLSKKFVISLSSDQWLFKEGSMASFFFIIAQGHVEVIKKGQYVRKLGPRECFGQMALLYGIKRSSSIRIVKQFRAKNFYYALNKSQFLQAIQYFNSTKNSQFLSMISNYLPFSYLTSREKFQLAKQSIKLSFKKGDRILSKFDEPYCLFLIKNGLIKLNFPNKKYLDIGEGNLFGYSGSNTIQCSATSIGETNTYAIGRDSVNKILARNIKFLNLWSKVKYALLNCNKISSLSLERIQHITALFQYKFITKQEPICFCHSSIKKIYILISCSQNLQVLGIQQLFSGKKKYLFDVIAIKSGHYAQIDSDLFVKLVQDSNFTISDQYLKGFNHSNSQNLAILRHISDNNTQVFLYKEKRFNLHYVLQTAQKNDQRSVQYLKIKAQILRNVNSRLIQGVYFFEQRESEFILAKQFIRGTTIKQNIVNIGIIPYSISRFYIACIVIIIQCLHLKNIVCRNLSINDFKIDQTGYLCMNQFQAAFLSIQQNGKKQINGNIIQNFKRVGLITYELLVGHQLCPFPLNDGNINIQQLNFPLNFKRKQAKDLIQSLLFCEKIVDSGWAKVKQMTFFQGIDWKALLTKQFEAPIIPGFMICNPLIV